MRGWFVRQVVAKFYAKDARTAVEAVERAYTDAPDLFRRHLGASPPETIPLGAWFCVMQDVACGDLAQTRPLGEGHAVLLLAFILRSAWTWPRPPSPSMSDLVDPDRSQIQTGR